MPWWAWFVFGAALLAGEVALSTDFYLVFFGVAALLVGVLGVAGVPLAPWVQWALFGFVAVGFLVLYRERLRSWLMRPAQELNREIVGKQAIAVDVIEAGDTGRVELRGSRWRAVNESDQAIAAGENCRVARADGLTLYVSTESPPSSVATPSRSP